MFHVKHRARFKAGYGCNPRNAHYSNSAISTLKKRYKMCSIELFLTIKRKTIRFRIPFEYNDFEDVIKYLEKELKRLVSKKEISCYGYIVRLKGF